MCVTINKYQNIIYRLENDIYPEFQQLLNSITAGSLTLKVNRIISTVQKDFESLKIIDSELIFPTVLSLFNEGSKDDEFAPDIKTIINITGTKEEKLKRSVDQISVIFENREMLMEPENKQVAVVEKLRELIYFFYNRFLPAKQLWKQWLLRLRSSDDTQCNNRINGKCKCSHNTDDKKISDEVNIQQP